MLDLSVVIRCGDDNRVFDCVRSIDEYVEIIISTSSNPDFEKKLADAGLRYVIAPRGNLSVVSNVGFEAASKNRVLITDSDTIFEQGCIRMMYDGLDDFKVVRARLKFRHDPKTPASRLVAECRDFVNSKPLVYTPGIAVRKEIVQDIGGYLFNPPVPYAVDADLTYRIQQARIPVKFLPEAVLIHDSESIRHDLKAASRIGRGCRISAGILADFPHYKGHSSKYILKLLKGVKPSDYPLLIKSKGLTAFCYQLLWDVFFHFGTWRNTPRPAKV
jgi:hypothetical protein